MRHPGENPASLADEWAKATCTCGGVSACLPCQYADRITVLADAGRDTRDAWDEGYHAGQEDARAVQAAYPWRTRNPYRADAALGGGA